MRYPFRHAVKEFMAAYRGVYADTTYRELDRRFRRIGGIFEELRREGAVSTTDPARITPEDVKEFAVYLRTIRGVEPSSLQHDVGTLQTICMFNENDCVRFARAKYPLAFPVRGKVRNPVVEKEDLARIVRASDEAVGRDLRSFAAVLLAFGSGMRPCEIRAALICDVDLVANTVFVRRPKGGDSWGIRRTVPLRPECRGVLARYVMTLDGPGSGLLFPNPDGREVSENTLRVWRVSVNEATGIAFDFRKCRRTYGQYLLDEGFSLEDVSALLGHTTETTTAVFYARRRPDRVVKEVLAGWETKEADDGIALNRDDAGLVENDGAREGI